LTGHGPPTAALVALVWTSRSSSEHFARSFCTADTELYLPNHGVPNRVSPFGWVALEQPIDLSWPKLGCNDLIENARDRESTPREILADLLKQRLALVVLRESELDINEVDLRKRIAALEDAKLATLDVDLQQDRVSETADVDALIQPLDWHLDGLRTAETVLAL
jgi:hypothetical protein